MVCKMLFFTKMLFIPLNVIYILMRDLLNRLLSCKIFHCFNITTTVISLCESRGKAGDCDSLKHTDMECSNMKWYEICAAMKSKRSSQANIQLKKWSFAYHFLSKASKLYYWVCAAEGYMWIYNIFNFLNCTDIQAICSLAAAPSHNKVLWNLIAGLFSIQNKKIDIKLNMSTKVLLQWPYISEHSLFLKLYFTGQLNCSLEAEICIFKNLTCQ